MHPLAHRGCDATVALGAVIQGATLHFEYVCRAATKPGSTDSRRANWGPGAPDRGPAPRTGARAFGECVSEDRKSRAARSRGPHEIPGFHGVG